MPVAEHANHSGSLTLKGLCGRFWTLVDDVGIVYKWRFNSDYTCTFYDSDGIYHYKYYISGDVIIAYGGTNGGVVLFYYAPKNALLDFDGHTYK